MNEKNKLIISYITNQYYNLNKAYPGILNQGHLKKALKLFLDRDDSLESSIAMINILIGRCVESYLQRNQRNRKKIISKIKRKDRPAEKKTVNECLSRLKKSIIIKKQKPKVKKRAK